MEAFSSSSWDSSYLNEDCGFIRYTKSVINHFLKRFPYLVLVKELAIFLGQWLLKKSSFESIDV